MNSNDSHNFSHFLIFNSTSNFQLHFQLDFQLEKETIYPLPEATAMGILFLGLNVFAVVFTLLGEKLRNSETGSMFVPLLGSVVMMTIATAGVLLFKGDYKRLKFEKMRETEERIKSPAFDRKITLTVK
eukprot:TRINITY_DN3938_c0_g2_i3.p1 TRINITY_DN3938_c0_g2~~TRINITY_DN3938_c0_g2_i3.p1  ORF type:complete len:129 (-),score=56.12 TRINITY_DN3938_c0_g2_i3:29-415(-)